jgi:gamma-glutamyltranspeptidase/glutathione hydrolase
MTPTQIAFGRTAEPWLDFDPTRVRPAHGRAAAATANPLASWAAVTVLHEGGTAIDAAVAAQAVLTVVEPNASGVGGGAIILIHQGNRVHAIDGLSAAPARVTARSETDFDGRSIPPIAPFMAGAPSACQVCCVPWNWRIGGSGG